jgi:very-short-patch-repair endonuclease
MRLSSTEGTKKARKLRRIMTLPELLLWKQLRQRPGGMKFRRQHPAGPFVLDFYCDDLGLAIEVDGEAHNRGNRPERDGNRDRWLREQGIEVLRIAASDVLKDMDAVIRLIKARANPLHQPSAGPPPLQGGIS